MRIKFSVVGLLLLAASQPLMNAPGRSAYSIPEEPPQFTDWLTFENLGPQTSSVSLGLESCDSFETPENLGPVVNSSGSDHRPTLSPDGLSLYFGSNRPGSVGSAFEGTDLWVSQRDKVGAPWGAPVKVDVLNSTWDDNAPVFSPDGHWIYFASDRPGGCGPTAAGVMDIYVSHRRHIHDDFDWDPPVNLGCTINTQYTEDGPAYFEDENGFGTLYVVTVRPDGLGFADIFVSHATANDHVSFGPLALEAQVSSPSRDARCSVTPDGLEFYLSSTRPGSMVAADGTLSSDIWVSQRATINDPWNAPVNAGPTINTPFGDFAPFIGNGRYGHSDLYFHSNRPGSLPAPNGTRSNDLWVAKRRCDNDTGGEAPELILDMELLRALGRNEVEGQAGARAPLVFHVFVNEVGEITSVHQVRGPRASAVEAELQRARVVTPGRRGAEPVPMAILVTVPIE
jgi:WD40-like Beta Propeller Repeat